MDAHSGGEIRASCPFADSRPEGCICIALREPKRVSIDYQARFCLTDRHVQCRRFQRAVPEVPEAVPTSKRLMTFDSRTFLVAGGIAALLLVFAAAFTFHGTWAGWFSDRSTPTSASSGGTTVNVRPTTIVLGRTGTDTPRMTTTPEPSAIPVLVATPTSSASVSAATRTPAPNPTPSSAATQTPSPTPEPSPTPTPKPVAPTPTPAVAETLSSPADHVVTQGETLNSISRAYGVPAGLIVAANNLANVDVISSGTTLYIPSADGHLPDDAPNLGVHIVAAGDSLSAIASDFGVTVQNVMAANGITDPNHIEVGQVITIPKGNVAVPTPTPVPQTTYTVQPGDTLYSISQRYGVAIEAIMTANNLTDRTYIYTGEVLVIPTG